MQENLQSKYDLKGMDKNLRDAKKEQDKLDFEQKKEVWRSIMAQKLGLKSLKQLINKGNELNVLNQYGEKLVQKRSKHEELNKRI